MSPTKEKEVPHETPKVDLIKKGEELLNAALATEPTKRTCKDDWGKHDWIALMSEPTYLFCMDCKVPKTVWDGQRDVNVTDQHVNVNISDNSEKKTENTVEKDKRIANLIPFKSGDEWRGNREGRPKGSKNMSTLVFEYLKSRHFVIKDNDDNKIKVEGDVAFADAIVELAIKNKDREALRMIWEFMEGKPTQQHKIEVNGAKGYQVDPEREKMIHEQFGLYTDRIVEPQTPQIEAREAQTVEVVPISNETPKVQPEQVQAVPEVVKVANPQPTHATNTITQPNGGVSAAPTSHAGGVREA